jgi:hypothetical protein
MSSAARMLLEFTSIIKQFGALKRVVQQAGAHAYLDIHEPVYQNSAVRAKQDSRKSSLKKYKAFDKLWMYIPAKKTCQCSGHNKTLKRDLVLFLHDALRYDSIFDVCKLTAVGLRRGANTSRSSSLCSCTTSRVHISTLPLSAALVRMHLCHLQQTSMDLLKE